MTMNFADRFCTVEDMTIRYWDEGTGEPLLLIHGVGGSIESWAYNIPELAEKYRVIALDIPGNGKSSRPTRKDVYSLEYAGNFMHQFAEGLGLKKYNLAGNSMGGFFALQLTYMFPQSVAKLILVDAAGLSKDISLAYRLFSIKPLGEILLRPNRFTVKSMAKFLLFRDELVTDEFVDMMLAMAKIPGTTESFLRVVRTGVNLKGVFAAFTEEKLKRLSMPVLIIWGKQDLALPPRHAELALKSIPDCRVAIVNEAGHVAQMDRPKVFNKLVFDFVDDGRLSMETSEKKIFFLE
jgi:pimeloyl-ACP methyl ester carboxylesterase